MESLCREYSYYPFFYPVGHPDAIAMKWYPNRQGSRYTNSWGLYYDDANAMLDLADLAEDGLIPRLRKCGCGRWLYAKFEHQRFCSAKCREKAFRSDPAEKAKRREWARRNYWLHKNKNVK